MKYFCESGGDCLLIAERGYFLRKYDELKYDESYCLNYVKTTIKTGFVPSGAIS